MQDTTVGGIAIEKVGALTGLETDESIGMCTHSSFQNNITMFRERNPISGHNGGRWHVRSALQWGIVGRGRARVQAGEVGMQCDIGGFILSEHHSYHFILSYGRGHCSPLWTRMAILLTMSKVLVVGGWSRISARLPSISSRLEPARDCASECGSLI